jgi:membrane protein YdbS with pleckstrin-like domain
MESGWDPDVKSFLLKILNSISLVLVWLIAGATAGIYFKLGYDNGKPIIYTILFYVVMAVTFFLLIRHLYRMWNK